MVCCSGTTFESPWRTGRQLLLRRCWLPGPGCRVGIIHPRITVRYKNLTISAYVTIGHRNLPSLAPPCLQAKKRENLPIVEAASGILQPGVFTLLLGGCPCWEEWGGGSASPACVCRWELCYRGSDAPVDSPVLDAACASSPPAAFACCSSVSVGEPLVLLVGCRAARQRQVRLPADAGGHQPQRQGHEDKRRRAHLQWEHLFRVCGGAIGSLRQPVRHALRERAGCGGLTLVLSGVGTAGGGCWLQRPRAPARLPAHDCKVLPAGPDIEQAWSCRGCCRAS